jgi:hypothetical protein
MSHHSSFGLLFMVLCAKWPCAHMQHAWCRRNISDALYTCDDAVHIVRKHCLVYMCAINDSPAHTGAKYFSSPEWGNSPFFCVKCLASCSIQIVYTVCLLPGRVYNVTHYMDFHPGGDAELMRGIGQDGTSLFNQVSSTNKKCTKNFAWKPWWKHTSLEI